MKQTSTGLSFDLKKIERGVELILEGLRVDMSEGDRRRTPKRYAKMCKELFSGYLESFPDVRLFPAPNSEEVIQFDFHFVSMCEHHLVPFIGRAQIRYQPDKHIIGYSKVPRIAKHFIRRLTLQERLTQEICYELYKILQPKWVEVTITGLHLCGWMRGPKTHCLFTTFLRLPKGKVTIEHKDYLVQDFFRSVELL